MIQISNTEGFVVSRLCCHACWELLEVLRVEGLLFHARGYYTTPYPVDLPHFLPSHIFQEMVSRFQKQLYQELISLLDSSPGHTRSISGGSHTSNLTVSSDGSIEVPDRRDLGFNSSSSLT